MTCRSRLTLLWMGALLAITATLPPHALRAADSPGVVLQVSDSNPATWNQALNVAENVQQRYGRPVQVELVAFGQGLHMLRFESEVGARLKKAAVNGVALRACGTTMGKMKLTPKDLYQEAGIQVVPAGAVQIIHRQEMGWAYVRP